MSEFERELREARRQQEQRMKEVRRAREESARLGRIAYQEAQRAHEEAVRKDYERYIGPIRKMVDSLMDDLAGATWGGRDKWRREFRHEYDADRKMTRLMRSIPTVPSQKHALLPPVIAVWSVRDLPWKFRGYHHRGLREPGWQEYVPFHSYAIMLLAPEEDHTVFDTRTKTGEEIRTSSVERAELKELLKVLYSEGPRDIYPGPRGGEYTGRSGG